MTAALQQLHSKAAPSPFTQQTRPAATAAPYLSPSATYCEESAASWPCKHLNVQCHAVMEAPAALHTAHSTRMHRRLAPDVYTHHAGQPTPH